MIDRMATNEWWNDQWLVPSMNTQSYLSSIPLYCATHGWWCESTVMDSIASLSSMAFISQTTSEPYNSWILQPDKSCWNSTTLLYLMASLMNSALFFFLLLSCINAEKQRSSLICAAFLLQPMSWTGHHCLTSLSNIRLLSMQEPFASLPLRIWEITCLGGKSTVILITWYHFVSFFKLHFF